jgi:hypothetical protein
MKTEKYIIQIINILNHRGYKSLNLNLNTYKSI